MAQTTFPVGPDANGHSDISKIESSASDAFSPHQALDLIFSNIELLAQKTDLSKLFECIKNSQKTEQALRACKDELEHSRVLNKENLDMYSEDRERRKLEISELQQQLESLQVTIREKDDAIKRLEEDKVNQRLDHQHNIAESEKAIQNLKNSLRALKQDLASQMSQSKEKDLEVNRLNLKLQAQGDTLYEVKKDAEKRQKELALVASLRAPLRTGDDMSNTLKSHDNVWKDVTHLATEFYGGHWSGDNVKALAGRLGRLQAQEGWAKSLPLPQTDSAAARRMQVITVMAHIARIFDRKLFYPTLLFGEQSKIRETLARQARVNSDQEAAFRASLLALMPEEQEEAANNQMNEACQEVFLSIGSCVPPTSQSRFKKRLKELAKKAYQAWQDVCHNECFFETRFDEDHVWQLPCHELVFVNEQPEIKLQGPESSDQGRTVLVIYPHLYWLDEDGDELEETGVVLTEDQVREARDELQGEMLQRRDSARTGPTRSRKPSMTSSPATSGPGFLGSPGSRT